MSQENVELVRSAIEAYSADPEAYLDFVAEDVEVHPDASRFTEPKPFRGRDEYRSFLAEIDEGWEGRARTEFKEIFPVGDDRVVCRVEWGGRGRASGIELRSNLTAICTVRDGKIAKFEYFFDHAEALEAAGLSE